MTALQAQAYQLIDQLPEEELAEAVKFLKKVHVSSGSRATEERMRGAEAERKERMAAFARLDALCNNTPKLKISDEEWNKALQEARLGKYDNLLDK